MAAPEIKEGEAEPIGGTILHGQEYQEGRRDGRIEALERFTQRMEVKHDNHERRLVYLERIVWGLLGILALSSIWPQLSVLLHGN